MLHSGTTTTGATSNPGRSGEASHSGSDVASQNRRVCSAPSNTKNDHPCACPADGARRARSSSRSTTSASTGRAEKLRHMRRRRMATSSSIPSDANGPTLTRMTTAAVRFSHGELP